MSRVFTISIPRLRLLLPVAFAACSLCLGGVSTFAQSGKKSTFDQQSVQKAILRAMNHPLAPRQPRTPSTIGTGTITVVALRVDFPLAGADSGLMTGDGKFDLSTRFRIQDIDTVIDPPPHDSLYYLAHFNFLDNYFNTVSRGDLRVNAILVPGIVHMSKQTKYYSPTRFDQVNVPLANLVKEAWLRADSLKLLDAIADQIDTSRTMFVIFHAGAGRDIDLISTFGYDPTPNDLPSMYFNQAALQDALGSNFDGIPVANGKVVIRGTGIMPEAETRTIPNPQNKQQTLLIAEGMNGLAAAEVGSFLGLPELSNTTDNKTAVGQIALMDVAGMFGYGGLFPPEPMAWEKIRLGWVTPTEVTTNETLHIYAPVTATAQGKLSSSIFQIPISADEYYLLEVRRRDANSDGAKFSTYQATRGLNSPYEYVVYPHQDATPDSIWGVLTAADEYDWASFASLSQGGIAIWHVDESIIRNNEATNSINADLDHRAIVLEEANTIPEIGIPITTPFGTFISTGTQTDLWYNNNSDRVLNDPQHINEFSQNTLPPSKSNTGAPSYVKLTNFSDPGNIMTVQFTRDVPSSSIAPMNGFPLRMNGAEDSIITGIVTSDGTGWLVTNSKRSSNGRTGSSYYLWKAPSGSGWSGVTGDSSSGAFFNSGFVPREAVLRANGNDVVMYTIEDSIDSHRLALRDLGATGAPVQASVSYPFAAGPLMLDGDTVVVGIRTTTTSSGLATYSSDLANHLSSVTTTGSIHAFSVFASSQYYVSCDSQSRILGSIYAIQNESNRLLSGTLFPNGESPVHVPFAMIGDALHQACAYNFGGSSVLCEPLRMSEGALANLEGDATLEVVCQGTDHVAAFNYTGAPASNLYFIGQPGEFTGNPLIADVQPSEPGLDVLFCKDGQIQSYNASTGHVTSGFPLAAGAVRRMIALARGSELDLFAIADTGTVLGWSAKVGPLGLPWPMVKHDAAQTAHAPDAQPLASPSDFFPTSRAYVWPNPALNGDAAHIRLYVSKDATADCLIVNDAGEQVATLKGNCTGGTDNELLWDTKPLGNGVYTCRLKVAATDGETGQKLIKIAVVK
jgi:M6 family metalloprotease-like protein